MMSGPAFDIIVTHYDEPWEVCKPFFDMIDSQKGIDHERFTVTLVQDGAFAALPWTELLSGYTHKTRIVTIDHSGVSAARNAGMRNTHADWIMFFDIDDAFSDVCAIKMILNQFPVNACDVIWSRIIKETRWQGRHTYFNCVNEPDLETVTGKLYRRAFLEEHDITFCEELPIYADYIFNSIVFAEVLPTRVAQLTTEFYVVFKSLRENSFRHSASAVDAILSLRFYRNMYILNEFKRKGLTYNADKQAFFMLCSEYFRIFNPDTDTDNDIVASDAFLELYHDHRPEFSRLSVAEQEIVMDNAESEAMEQIQSFYNDFNTEYYIANDTSTFKEWLDRLNRIDDASNTDTSSDEPEPVAVIPMNEADKPDPRVVVYCGTRNTYCNMMTSAKSLLYNTRVDKIYFLIEDDTFPYDIPDIIECVNVQNQSFFPQDGPNYDNAWSYMCMMRAAFTKLIPYDKILSLDIDVIIQEDIGCLWDIDLNDYYLAGVPEPQRQKTPLDPMYINFGVVMMNLRKIRDDHIDDIVIDDLNTNKLGCPEQDAFNHACVGHILPLSNDYNATVHSHITGDAETERIIHYAGIRFWRHYGRVKEFSDRPWNIIMEHNNTIRGDIT